MVLKPCPFCGGKAEAANAIEELSANYERALIDLVKQAGPPREE